MCVWGAVGVLVLYLPVCGGEPRCGGSGRWRCVVRGHTQYSKPVRYPGILTEPSIECFRVSRDSNFETCFFDLAPK